MRPSLKCAPIMVASTLWSHSLLAQSQAAATQTTIVHQTVHAQTKTECLVMASPDANCLLRRDEDATDPAAGLKVYADVRGVVTFSTWFEKVGRVARLTLNCRGPDRKAAVVSYPIEIRVVPDSQAVTSDTDYVAFLPVPGYWVPALPGDPLSYSQDELETQGYPRRPDPVRSPGMYQLWLQQVSQPFKVVVPNLVPDPDADVELSGTTTCSSNWAGFALRNAPCGVGGQTYTHHHMVDRKRRMECAVPCLP
jgi:hypothetical protein